MGHIAAGIPGGDALHPQQHGPGCGEVDAVAPALRQEMLHKVAAPLHGWDIQVIHRLLRQILGRPLGGGHVLQKFRGHPRLYRNHLLLKRLCQRGEDRFCPLRNRQVLLVDKIPV